MMTQQIGFSVLSAPLAAIDRRALSQAWYSALHMAREISPEAQCEKQHVSSAEPRERASKPPSRTKPVSGQPSSPAHSKNEKREVAHQPPAERRAARSPLARKIENSFLHPCCAVQRATFTIDGTQSRVHVALQTSGNNMRLIAICPPSLRAAVARALEEARYALAERGIVFSAETEER